MLLVPHYLAEFMWDQRFKDSFTFGLMWPNSYLYELHCKNLDFFKSTHLSKKSHICKEGGHTSQLTISIWHLLMNLKKKLLKWVNKKWKNFNIYNVAFFNKNKEKHPEISLLCTKNLHDMINRYQDIQCDRLKLVIMGHFLPFHSSP